MADALDVWAVEPIPDTDTLYMRAHKNYFFDGMLAPGVFRDREGAMSTDWCKYSTAEETQMRARSPKDNSVVQFPASSVRAIPLTVEHTPDVAGKNRAHSDVIGEKTTEVRIKLHRVTTIALDAGWGSVRGY